MVSSVITRLRPGSRPDEVICPKCLNRLRYDDTTRDVLQRDIIRVKDPATDKQREEQGGCPATYTVITDRGEQVTRRCGYVFPMRYLENSARALPFFVQVFGWSGHGKTVYLDALRLALLDMRTLWPRFVHQSVTNEDMEYEKTLRRYQMYGYVAESTDKKDRDANQVYITQLDNMVRWGSRSLVIMDHAGERFADFNVPVDEIPFLRDTPTAFMLISISRLTDPEAASGQSMDQLLNIYLETILRIQQQDKDRARKDRARKGKTQHIKRKLVVVLTMADIITHLPQHLRNYVVSDETWSLLRSKGTAHMDEAAMAAYLERMAWVSDEIREWLLRDSDGAPGGSNLVGLIESNDFEARYTLVSATGHDNLHQRPKDEASGSVAAGIQITPRRVLDPFYWALEFQSTT